MTKVMEDTRSKSEVTFPSSDPSCQLHGDLTLPISSSDEDIALLPAIVIVAGSGPVDRNGNAPSMRLNFNIYNRFAQHIHDKPSSDNTSCSGGGGSIAVLSYDKRGAGKSQPILKDKNYFYKLGMMDLVADAVEAVKFVASHPRIDKNRIVLLGHSEGAIILPLICREITNDETSLQPIAGCIFYSGFGENLIDVMAFQRTTLANEVQTMSGPTGWILRRLLTKEYLDKKYNEFMKQVNDDGEPDYVSLMCGLVKQPAKWVREHASYSAEEALSKHVTCHCLAITGQKDFQVRNEYCTRETAKGLVPNAASVEVHRPPNLTHLLRSMEGEAKMMNMKKDYKEMGKLPLDEVVMEITYAWCDRVLFEKQ
mmetsp:Transcript_35043/g.64910  ORF Transcript_35043/g.64910 Transcript_35043/m.64910 type:complete len:368 (+) Transcript_35043:120-1223(+)|eukprot:CAMPEP_0196130158 /NCGR_PEP_ID=MMETSP0910-20130528/625_1 /TAXON_ID=49265 /ORGANISM="Thalassiosira rotula, Strain GSO102" /LENGTH=367 /DNA_ID=CAMNT_0041389407 /DNA_START=93 /DNA_END=1196 /DNA_ORIENTATION=-